MKVLATAALLLLVPMFVYAEQPKPCEELKADIVKKLEANNVKNYTLDIVDKDKEAAGKVVGTCDGGTKKIVYQKAPAQPPAK